MAKRLRMTVIFSTILLAIAAPARAQSGGKPIPSDEARKILSRALDDTNRAADGEARLAALQTILRLEVHAGNSAEARRQIDLLDKTDEIRKDVLYEIAIAM